MFFFFLNIEIGVNIASCGSANFETPLLLQLRFVFIFFCLFLLTVLTKVTCGNIVENFLKDWNLTLRPMGKLKMSIS